MRGVVNTRTMSLYDSVSSEGSAPAAAPAAAASSSDDSKKAAGAVACVLAVLLGYWYFTQPPSTVGMPPPPSSAVAPLAGSVSTATIMPSSQLGSVHSAVQMSFRGVLQHPTPGASTCVTPSSTISPPTQSLLWSRDQGQRDAAAGIRHHCWLCSSDSKRSPAAASPGA